MNAFRLSIVVAGVAAAGSILGASSALSQSKIIRVEAGNPGSVTTTLVTVLSKIYKREFNYSLQINDGQTLTRSALKLGRGQIDLMPLPPIIYFFMSKGSAMYKKKLHKQAIEASKNVRMIAGHVANLYHAVAFDNAGVKTWKGHQGQTRVHRAAVRRRRGAVRTAYPPDGRICPEQGL